MKDWLRSDARQPPFEDARMDDADEASVSADRRPDAAPAGNPQAERNLLAFLQAIRVAEGTADADGYRALFGHTARRPRLFAGFGDHPRIATRFTDRHGRRLWTTAAGAFQIMCASPLPGGGRTKVDTWGSLQARLKLPDFSPSSQVTAATELIREAGALSDVYAGDFGAAVSKVRHIWASLPGAGYGQPERPLAHLILAYKAAGGQVTGPLAETRRA